MRDKPFKPFKPFKEEFKTTLMDWAAFVTAFALIICVTVGPILFGLAIFAAVVKLCWYVLFKL